MTDKPPRSMFSGSSLSQNISQDMAEADDPAAVANSLERQPNLMLEIQALQILDSSDDCIKVLDLEGHILFINRAGQLLLGIEDIRPFLNAPWVEFWQEADRQAVLEAIARAGTGEVCTLQGYCPTLKGEPKWWDSKISPLRGAEGQIEQLLCISRDITDRKRVEDERKRAEDGRQQTEAALWASEEQFRLFTTASSDAVYKMSADWREMRFLEGKNFLASTQHSSQTWLEYYIPSEERSRVRGAIAEAIRAKSAFELEHRVIQLDGTIGWTFSRAIPLLNEQGEIVEWLGAASNVTTRKQAELSAEFLATVTHTLAEATCVEDIIQTVGEQLHRYLQVCTCAFIEINESAEVATIHHSWHQEDVPSLVGTYHLPEFVTGEFFQAARTGQTIIVRDATTDPRIADPQRFAALKIGSFINVPLIREDEWKFTLGIYHQTPYNWLNTEIELMRELANRVWTKLERTRVEVALRESEAQYRSLFQSIDEGYAVVEVLADDNGNWNDFLFLEVNLAFEQQTGMVNSVGRKATEILGTPNPAWAKIYGQVAQTGEPVRFEQQEETLDRIFDLYAFRLGKAGSRRVAVLFTDITDRKRREANAALLVEIGDVFSHLSTADEIMQTVGARIGAYLQVTTCNFADVDEARDQVTAHYGWSSPGVQSTVGTFCLSRYLTKEFERASRAGETVVVCNTQTDPRTDAAGYAALNMHSFVTVPFHQHGRWTHYIAICDSRPRNWRDDEIELIEEIANQIFPRLERARAEAALRESEERFRTVTATVPQLIWTALPDGSVNYLSDQWADYIGLPPEQLYDWSWQQITHPDDLPNTLRDWQHCIQSGEPVEIQHRFRYHTGEWRWQLVRGVPIKDATGNVRQWVGTCTDIQAEVDIKEALRESEAKYRSLFNSMDEGFCIIEVLFDATGNAFDYRFLESNPAFEKHTGMVDVIGKTMRELVPEHEIHWYEIYGEVVLTGVPKRFENVAQELGRFYDVYAFRVGEPHERKVAVLFNDISERKRAEQDLQESEEWARLAIQVARLGGWRLDLDTNLVEMDERMREIWGEPKDTVTVPLPQVLERMHPDDRERVATAVTAAIDPQSTGTYEIEYRLVWNDGTEHWVLAKGQAQFEGEGDSRRTVDFFGTLLDITDRKRAEVEREQLLRREQAAREEAERANRVKDEFLAVLSHELRSPLNPILGWTRLLKNGNLDETRQQEALNTIERNAKLQTQLIEDLLDISRIMRGKLSLTVAPVSLTFVITAALETVRLAAAAKQIQISLDLPTVIPPVSGDAARLQQVVWNLLSNAVKFTPNGGQVVVELRQLDQVAQIRVIDTGKGVAPEFLPYMFDYFRQADATTTRKFGGLGLGLAIVRQIVEMHGGSVWAESEGENRGAILTVQLPLSLQASTQELEPSPEKEVAETLPLNNLQILLVDDETDAREFQAFVLEQGGAKVTAVASALEALQALDQFIPDILVSDVGMPQMDGYMLMKQIRSRPAHQGGTIRAIALTAYASDSDQQKAFQAGFQAHLTKPIEPQIW